MHLIQIDVVGVQPAKTVLTGLDHPASRAASMVAVSTHRVEALGGHDNVIATACQRLADDRLALAVGVDVCRVKKVDP